MNKDGKDYEEDIEVDVEKGTETFHVPKTSPDEEAGDIVYDFKKVIDVVKAITGTKTIYIRRRRLDKTPM